MEVSPWLALSIPLALLLMIIIVVGFAHFAYRLKLHKRPHLIPAFTILVILASVAAGVLAFTPVILVSISSSQITALTEQLIPEGDASSGGDDLGSGTTVALIATNGHGSIRALRIAFIISASLFVTGIAAYQAPTSSLHPDTVVDESNRSALRGAPLREHDQDY